MEFCGPVNFEFYVDWLSMGHPTGSVELIIVTTTASVNNPIWLVNYHGGLDQVLIEALVTNSRPELSIIGGSSDFGHRMHQDKSDLRDY